MIKLVWPLLTALGTAPTRQLRRLTERCIEDGQLREQIVQLTDLAGG